jgi:hypothetical protein
VLNNQNTRISRSKVAKVTFRRETQNRGPMIEMYSASWAALARMLLESGLNAPKPTIKRTP